eukprot:380602_1
MQLCNRRTPVGPCNFFESGVFNNKSQLDIDRFIINAPNKTDKINLCASCIMRIIVIHHQLHAMRYELNQLTTHDGIPLNQLTAPDGILNNFYSDCIVYSLTMNTIFQNPLVNKYFHRN